MPEEAKARLSESQAELKQRSTEWERTHHLVQTGSLVGDKFDQASFLHSPAESSAKSTQAAVVTSNAKVAAEKAHLQKAQADTDSVAARKK